MQDGEYFQEDIESLRRDVERLQRALSEFSEVSVITPVLADVRQGVLAEDLRECQERAIRLLDRIKRLLAEIHPNIQPTNEATAFHLATLTNELKAQIDWLKETLEYIESWGRGAPVWLLEQIAGPVQAALQKLRSYLVPLLKRFLSKIWQIISHMLTPKEWKLTGKVGTGVLGLADVGIEITFGP
jgi:hypothetical protein